MIQPHRGHGDDEVTVIGARTSIQDESVVLR